MYGKLDFLEHLQNMFKSMFLTSLSGTVGVLHILQNIFSIDTLTIVQSSKSDISVDVIEFH